MMQSWLIALTWIPFFLLGWILVRRAFRTSNLGAALGLASMLALAFAVVGGGSFGRLFQSLAAALVLSSGLALVASLLLLYLFPAPALPTLRFPEANRWTALWLLAVLLVSGLIALVCFKYAIFDEMALQAHIPVVESILRGRFPPSYNAFPEIPYRYHYGFNLLAAYLSLSFGLPGYLGVDLATLGAWFVFVALLFIFFRRFGLSGQGLALGFLLVTMSGGLSWLLFDAASGPGPSFQLPYWQSMQVFGRMLHPHFMMYLFQHPMGLGIAFFLGVLLAFDEWLESKNRWALAVTILALGALSLTQVVLFATLLASLALVFAYLCFFKRDRGTYWWAGLFTGGMALVLAFALGGFFAFSPYYEKQPLLISWPPGYLRWEYFGSRIPISAAQSFRWYLAGFGALVFFIPAAWLAAFRRRKALFSLLAIFGILSFLIPQFFRYSYSWDIIKWFFACELSGKLLIAVLFLTWALKDWKTATLAWALVLFSCVTPFFWLKDLAFKEPRAFNQAQLRVARNRQPQLDPGLEPAVRSMLVSPEPWGMLWASPGSSLRLLIFTGLPSLHADRNTAAMPVSRQLISKRREDLQRLESSPSVENLEALDVRWIYFSCVETRNKPELESFLKGLSGKPGIKDYSKLGVGGSCYYLYQYPKGWKITKPAKL